jgi:hypothetical protein
MSDKNTKKAPAAPGKNKLKVSTPREHIVLVGGPSDTYSGWFHYSNDWDYIPQKPPTSIKDVRRYTRVPDDPTSPSPAPDTHDRYWASFLEPVFRLCPLGYSEPSPCDIFTVMIYYPPFEYRQELDWEASDHNRNRWAGKSPWVKKEEETEKAPKASGSDAPKPKKAPELTPQQKEAVEKALLTRARVNHEIMMLELSDTEADRRRHIYKHPQYEKHWTDIITFLPRGVRGGSKAHAQLGTLGPIHEKLTGVLVKMLLINDPQEFYDYLTTGKWEGYQRVHEGEGPPLSDEEGQKFWDTHSTDGNWDALGSVPTDKKFKAGWEKKVKPEWDKTPSVDRSKIKIVQFDYFGHATSDAFFLQYGTKNDKGKDAKGEVLIEADELVTAIRGKDLFTKNALAQLWGCSLGLKMAPKLAEVIPIVFATEKLTAYDYILEEGEMPAPNDGSEFKAYTKALAKP